MLQHIKIFKILLLIILLSGISACYSPKYLSTYSNMDINPYGSYVTVFNKDKMKFIGELIAIDSTSLILLNYNSLIKASSTFVIPVSDISKLKIRYAHAPGFVGMFAIAILPVALHSGFAVLSGLNILITSMIYEIASEFYLIRIKKDFSSSAKKFARFPQGVPPGVNIDSLNYPKPQLPIGIKKMVGPDYREFKR